MALLLALHQTLGREGVRILAATVDHGLRPQSAAEACAVAEKCARLGIEHTTLGWQDPDKEAGNLQARAREARYALLSEWARHQGAPVLVLGHTAEDQAETVLMRLARGAGVTGLSAMPERRVRYGTTLLRPLLGQRRADLRAFLQAHDMSWIEDPSNEDTSFERVRMRQALAQFEALGISVQALNGVARNMASAREALDWYSFLAARDLIQIRAGAVLIDQRQFRALPLEIARRVLTGALHWIKGPGYDPRGSALSTFLESVRRGEVATLAGCLALARGGAVWLCREPGRIAADPVPSTQEWDARWKLAVTCLADVDLGPLHLSCLGAEGLKNCDKWRETGYPREVLMGLPALWQGQALIAAPIVAEHATLRFELLRDDEEFYSALLSH